MNFDEHQEHWAEYQHCAECYQRFCKWCSDAGLPKTFCCQECQDLYYSHRKVGVA